MNYDDPSWHQEQYENQRDELGSYDFDDYELDLDKDENEIQSTISSKTDH